MKLKKKLIAVVLVFLFLFAAGCSNDPATSTGDPTQNTQKPTNAQAEIGKMDWVWASNDNGAFSDVGYYYLTSEGFLYFLDTENALSVCLCSKVGCLHDKEEDPFKREECEAKLSGIGSITPVFYWDGGLFYVEADAYGTHLYRRNADGSGMTKVSTLGSQYTKEQKSVELFSFAIADGCLYYDAEVDSVVQDETGAGVVQRELCYIGRVNLQTGKDETLFSDANNYLMLCAAASDAALILSKGQPDLPVDDPGYAEALLNESAELLFWNGTVGEPVEVFQKTIRQCANITLVADGYVFYKGSTKESIATYRYDLRTGAEEKISDSAIRHINGRYALRMDNAGIWKVYDLQAKAFLTNDFSEDSLAIGTVSEDGFILLRGIREGNSIKERIYCYVTLMALEDGLQEADLMPFYTRQNTVLG